MVRLTRERKMYLGRRAQWRLHHGRVGTWLLAVGIALILDDLADYPWSWRD